MLVLCFAQKENCFGRFDKAKNMTMITRMSPQIFTNRPQISGRRPAG